MAQFRKRSVQKFYKDQNDLVNAWEEDEKAIAKLVDNAVQAEKDRQGRAWDTRLVTTAILLNIVIFAGKTAAAIFSHSLSVAASVVDSNLSYKENLYETKRMHWLKRFAVAWLNFMSITSGMILGYTCRLVERWNKQHCPVGLNRLQPLTTLVVGLVMVFTNLLVMLKAAIDAVTVVRVETTIVVALWIGTSMKAVMFAICYSRDTSASRVLANDQRSGCITNFIASTGAYVGHNWWEYADTIGAVLVSAFIITTWLIIVMDQIPLLIGRVASPQLISRIVNITKFQIAINHDQRIRYLDTVHVYQFGINFLVELHVVMHPEVSLYDAQNVTEELQTKVEQLFFVERAFVHCDYKFEKHKCNRHQQSAVL